MKSILSFRVHKKQAPTNSKPPKKAQRLLRFALKPADQEAILGDMEEIFNIMVKEDGISIASRWYIWQALRTSFAQLLNKLIKWGFVSYVADMLRKFIIP